MEDKTTKEAGYKLVQNFLRKAHLLKDATVFDQVPNILASVIIDKEIIRNIMIRELENNSKNPLNAILKLFGIRLISRDLSNSQYDETSSNFVSIQFEEALRVDEEKLTLSLNKIAESLFSQNNAFDKESSRLNEKYDELYTEYRNYRDNTENQLSVYQIQIKSVAMYVQYLLALRRKESGVSANFTDLLNILEQIDMSAVWSDDVEQKLKPKMFTMLKTSIPDATGIKPCIMFNQDVFLKGEIIEYVKDS